MPRQTPISLDKHKEEQLFTRYLEVCNMALKANKDKFPYKHLWDAAQKTLENKTISIAVYDDTPKATYGLTIQNNHVDVIAKTHEKPQNVSQVNMSHLEQVVAHPEEYIKNPAKIDWNWLKGTNG